MTGMALVRSDWMPATFGSRDLLQSPVGVTGNGVGSDTYIFHLGTWVKVVPLIDMGTPGRVV